MKKKMTKVWAAEVRSEFRLGSARASCSFTPCSRPADLARRVPTGAFVILMGLQQPTVDDVTTTNTLEVWRDKLAREDRRASDPPPGAQAVRKPSHTPARKV